MTTVTRKADIAFFKKRLAHYKQLIDDDVTDFARQIEKSTLQQYGAEARLATDAYLSVLTRGGKRIRGALTMLGYEMSGGINERMIIQAARVMEMINAYILIIDDIQDRSLTRRGGPAAHVMLADYHREHHLADDADHFGVSVALMSALSGSHAAQMILANLDAPEDLRLKAISILNRTLLVTTHGQTNDIVNEVVAAVDEAQVERVLEWKTAHYTFLNPLHMGMVLAGAECDATDAITDYAIHAGKAFQITDDILGTFGTEFESGKSPLDDIKEGKRTQLTVYALNHALNGNKNFLLQMLGNHHLTPAEFERCKDIIQACGALDHAREQAIAHIDQAVMALARDEERWTPTGATFLRGLAYYMLDRQA